MAPCSHGSLLCTALGAGEDVPLSSPSVAAQPVRTIQVMSSTHAKRLDSTSRVSETLCQVCIYIPVYYEKPLIWETMQSL